MSYEDWTQGLAAKVQSSWNLHEALPRRIDFFVLLSSLCGIFGNGGQNNYAADNTFQDALARHRVSLGEKAIAIDLGVVLSKKICSRKPAHYGSFNAFEYISTHIAGRVIRIARSLL